MDKVNLLKCLNHVKDNADRIDVWNKDVLLETIAYIETDGGATVPCSDGLAAIEVAKRLADWPRKYPRSSIYHAGRQAEMDGELIKIENAAKEINFGG